MVVCPSCGRENQAGARFCNSCGTEFSLASAGVRKTVTVLFCDLVGSTALGDGADPEIMRAQMSRYHARLREILEGHGGSVEKFIGDAAMAVFGLPTAHEDDALRAVRAAFEIRRGVDQLGFSVRIGINTGEVVAGGGETLVTGDAVNVAARLEQSAASGEILIGALTEQLVRGATRTEPLELQVKGKAAPLAAHRLLDEQADAVPAERRHDAPFVGRAPELAGLERAFLAAIDQRKPHLASIVGPPGIGKSRLVRELTARLPAHVLAGRCLSYGQGITYWPLQEIARQIGDFRAVLGTGDEADMAADRLAAALGEGTATPDEIAWGFRKLFEAQAGLHPLIVVVEDIHWAEPALLDLIEYIAEFSRDAPMVLLCTARAELLEIRPDWSTPRPNASVLTLEPLNAEQVETIVEQLGEMPAADRARIIAAAEGNPLFVEQLVAMRAEVTTADAPLEIPPTIQALLAARIDRLEPDERAVIERAAVEGRRFHRSTVQELLSAQARPEVGRKLLTLVRRQFIRPDRADLPGDDGFRFDHILIRDAAYDSLPKRVRAELHERFADWLERRLGTDAPPEILGYHLEQAFRYRAELGDPDRSLGERAADKLLSAAGAAAARQDVHAEVVLLERAVALLPEGDRREPRVLIDLGAALVAAGEPTRAIERFRDAEDLASATGADRLVWLARLRRHHAQADSDPAAAPDLLTREAEAAIAANADDDEVIARAWQLIANAHNWRGQLAEMYRAAQTAWEHARRTSDARLEVDVLFLSGAPIAFGPIPVEEGLRWVAEAVEQARNRSAAESWSHHMLAHLHARLGEFAAARAAMESWRARMRELGQLWRYFMTAGCVWDVCSLAGDWAAGEHALREAEAHFERTGDRSGRATNAACLAESLLRQGRLEEAEPFSRVSAELSLVDDPMAQAIWRRVRARLLAARGEFDEAESLARESVDLLAGTDLLDEHAAACLDLASVLVDEGKNADAVEHIRQAVALYDRKGNVVGRARAESLLASRSQ